MEKGMEGKKALIELIFKHRKKKDVNIERRNL
jgi:hypothetical protein